MAGHCVISPNLFDECRTVKAAAIPQTNPADLGCESACGIL